MTPTADENGDDRKAFIHVGCYMGVCILCADNGFCGCPLGFPAMQQYTWDDGKGWVAAQLPCLDGCPTGVQKCLSTRLLFTSTREGDWGKARAPSDRCFSPSCQLSGSRCMCCACTIPTMCAVKVCSCRCTR